ncbi:hypothetical protein [Ancylomarina longa]|uniref:Uncharacterized protein n=1 Tax=Ancylomarina longa TaxID=2487017 RepID=A0A434AVC4_9BACT|nr:hypothetical protein [Ancylomarina longa]RUT78399.1 hypothetical protein DLK05_08735 [Ancylomarina longa]
MKCAFLILLLFALDGPAGDLLIARNLLPSTQQDSMVSPYLPNSIFGSEEMIEICLKGSIRKLFNDRREEAAYYPMVMSYTKPGGEPSILDIKVKTRGHFRRDKQNCSTPPLWLNFNKDTTCNTIFEGQDKLKLVTTCSNESYVLREYLVYKIYQLITENSFRARLVKVCYQEIKTGKKTKPRYGIILEDQNHMAERNHSQLIKRLNVQPKITNREIFLKMAVFQYLIGNTDWSVQYLHNIKLISRIKTPSYITVPYDFDHAGIVGTTYAHPAEELQLQSVRERRYRGYCIQNPDDFLPIVEFFNGLRQEIYELYIGNKLLSEAYIKKTTKYLDEFYKTINNSKSRTKAFQYPCNPYGTGNVVIKGLKSRKK